MRGSVWTDIECYITNKNGSIRKSSYERIYTYGAVTDLNTRYQRQQAYEKCISKGLATYRQHQNLNSDDEVNYHYINSGIQAQSPKSTYTITRGKRKGTVLHGIAYKRIRLTGAQKRESHRKVVGQVKIIRKEDLNKQYLDKQVDIKPVQFNEITEKEYLHYTKNIKANKKKVSKPPR